MKPDVRHCITHVTLGTFMSQWPIKSDDHRSPCPPAIKSCIHLNLVLNIV